ncbi:FAD binding domain-containing protein [Dissophora ornata]|nr:FAD binding domain-containing protein [Dissophora ornata]
MAAIANPARTSEIPVLISGAGPVGTLAAIMLTRLGIPCRIIERELTVSPMSKALSIHARTLEILEQTGLIDQFLARGHPISHFNIYFNGAFSLFPGLINSISHYNYALFLEQIRTTAILTEELERQGLKVDRGWELMDTKVVEEGGKTWVETTIRRALDGNNTRSTESKIVGEVELDAEQADKEYETEVVKSEYLIAADGGKSVVRHKVHIPFVGRTLENNVILFDGNIETDLDVSNITVINGRNNQTMNVFPLSDGQVRIMVDGSDLDPTQELTNEAFEKVAQAAAAPAKFLIKSSSWLTFYRVNERQAETYSYKNRIFLAGDAAHVHSPAGGQGMNLGLQDAYNLTWKMALVLNGLSDATLLETYEGERAPVASNVINMSSAMFAMGFSRQLIRRILRKTVTTFASLLVRFITIPSGTVSMLTIRYHENRINQRHKTQPAPADEFQVGQRAHDGPLVQVLAGGQTSSDIIRLHQLIHGPGTFHILVFTSDMLSTTSSASSRKTDQGGIALTDESQLKGDIERHLGEWRSKWAYGSERFQQQQNHTRPMFNVHVIGALPETLSSSKFEDPSKIHADSLASKEAGEGRVYFDESSKLHERYGVPVKAGSGAIVVIRPDSHVGYRVQGAGHAAWQDVDEYLRSIFNTRV